MGLFNWISSASRAVGSAIVNTAKRMANDAISWMAEEAEGFMGSISRMWQRVKPFINHVRVAVQAISKFVPWPWLQKALQGIELLLASLEQIEKSDLFMRVKKAIEWIIKWAKEYQKKQMDEAAMAEARANAQAWNEARAHMQDEERPIASALSLMNNYLLVKAEVALAVSKDDLQDFEYFLRLRAVQKLLAYYETSMISIEQTGEISPDMYFIVEAAQALIAEQASFSEAQMLKLDEMTQRLFGKPIIPFIFEEMIMAWEINRKSTEAEWEALNRQLAKENMLLKRLKRAESYNEIEPDEVVELNNLNISVPRDTETLQQLQQEAMEKRFYVNAAEGFLQMLEKDEATLLVEGRDYLLEQGAEVGQLLMTCAQQGRSWSSLSTEQQALIVDFANIFEQDCRERTAQLVEVMG
ncbi:hypothetical protein [Erwinia sp. E_sp_B04_7]|uniref:hypothetical protein n=1 Tax=unclassified Erwinia TaxID=2622719 RepID=UPI0030D51295